MSTFFSITPIEGKTNTKDFSNQGNMWNFKNHITGSEGQLQKRSICRKLKQLLRPDLPKGTAWTYTLGKTKSENQHCSLYLEYLKIIISYGEDLDMAVVGRRSGKNGFTCQNRYWKLLTQGMYWDYENKATRVQHDLKAEHVNIILAKDPLVIAYIQRHKDGVEAKETARQER